MPKARASRPGRGADPKLTPASERLREDRRLTELRADFQQQLRDVKRELDNRGQEIASLTAQQDTLRSLASVRAERIRELEGELARRDEALEQLKAELEQQRAAPAQTTDDLKQMRGIGPTFERKLHALGVERFEQIAAWTDADVEQMAAKLSIHAGRIRRDGWVESARQFAGGADASPDEPGAPAASAPAASASQHEPTDDLPDW